MVMIKRRRPADQDVLVGAANEFIYTSSADQEIASTLANKCVIACATQQRG